MATPERITDGERTLALMMAWFSPSCPVGAYSYSHGLEQLEADGCLRSCDGARDAIASAVRESSGRSDAILLAHAWRAACDADEAALDGVRALALALAPSAERRLESVGEGNAFAALVDAVWPVRRTMAAEGDWAYPTAVGVAGALHAVPLGALAQAYVQAFAANLVSAAVRLVPLGQTDGQRLVASLAPLVATVAREAVDASLDDVGGAALGLDLASLRHECQEVRLFRS